MTDLIPAVVLAGGKGSRLGDGEKALTPILGKNLIDHVRKRLEDQVSAMALSIRTLSPWALELGLPILEDLPNPNRGPLGGVAAALAWAASQTPQPKWVLTVPVDTPFLPADLCKKLTTADQKTDVAVAASGNRVHHTVAAWRPTLAEKLLDAICSDALSVRRFQEKIQTVEIPWAVIDMDPFMNINTPKDLEIAEHNYPKYGDKHQPGLKA